MADDNSNRLVRLGKLLSNPEALKQTRVYKKLNSAWLIFYEFCTADKARELADASDSPEVTLSRMASMIVRSIPFMAPMFPHIAFMFCLGFANTLFYTATGTIMGDMWTNKILVADKLQPNQARLFLLDECFVRHDMLEGADVQQSAVREEPDSGVQSAPDGSNEDVESETEDPIGKLTTDQRRSVRNHMFVGFAILALYGIFQGFTLSYYGMWIWHNVNHNLRVAMMDRLEFLSMSFHHSNRSGDAIYRIYQDSSMIVNVLEEAVIGPMETIRGLTIAIWFVLLFDWLLLAGVFLVWIPALFLTIWYTPRIRKRSVANRVANSNFTSTVQETFRAARVVKATRSESMMLNRFRRDSKIALDAAFYLRFDMVMLSLIVGIVGGLMIIGTELLMVTWVLDQRQTMFPAWAAAWISFTAWNLGAFDAGRGRVGECIGTGKGLVRLWCMLQDLFIGLERAFYFLELKPGVEEAQNPKDYPTPVNSVSWRNVHFAYPAGDPVLKGVSLEAAAGTVTAIVGATGSGKSTLMTLLMRLYDPQEGTILINDVDLRQIRLEDIRTRTAIALQKNVLFTGRVRENIAYATENATIETVRDAARVACADEFIELMADGYDTQLGERGGKLSAGQRQRITIARAIVRDTPILVLDEPTASLDARTEQRVLQNVAVWGRERIVFIITHRLSTIRSADQIVFLKDGQIVEVGSHEELVAIEGGNYRGYVDAESDASRRSGTTGSSA